MSKETINAIRFTGVDMVNQANSGHPGIVLGAAPMMYTLFTRHLRYNPDVTEWFDRDRFVMAAGHGSALLYSMLHTAGFPLSMDDLKMFRQWESITPGHPEYGQTPGVDATSGPLGQGIAMAVGMAIAESHLGAVYNKNGFNIVDHETYVLCGDGDLQEGITHEAISLAGHLGLHKLIVLYDSNDVQLDGPLCETNSENTKLRFEAMNWQYLRVNDGEDIDTIDEALHQAKQNLDQPSIIEVKTVIGYGSPEAGEHTTHGSPLGEEATTFARKKLGYKAKAFDIASDAYEDVQSKNKALGRKKYEHWQESLANYAKKYPEEYKMLQVIMGEVPLRVDMDILKDYEPSQALATRASGGEILNRLQNAYPQMMGGSADLSSSTKVKGADGNYGLSNPEGRNINYGVREHAMAAITNGLCLHGIKAFSGGFFIFSDYMKPAMRMAALMDLPAIYVFTHDSVAVGEDGPTHEPVEQLAGLRAMPNMDVIRPADTREVKGAWRLALESTDHPTSLVLSRQNIDLVEGSDELQVEKGAYVISPEKEKAEMILIATGSEVSLAVDTQRLLWEKNIDTRVVSMPSFKRYLEQEDTYQDQVLLPDVRKRVAIEMGSTLGWGQFIGLDGLAFTINRFGASAKGSEVVHQYGFHTQALLKAIEAYR